MTDREFTDGKIISIVGTDTDVGKTIITAALARSIARLGCRVAAFKPFATEALAGKSGGFYSADADLISRAAGMPGGAEAACGQLFHAPLSPWAAASLEGAGVDVEAALKQTRAIAKEHDYTIVEGCGGLEVPLTGDETTADFFARLKAPVLVVARSGLGTINHTLLTVNALRGRRLKVLGVVLNERTVSPGDQSAQGNPDIIRHFADLPVWGPIAFQAELNNRRPDLIDVETLPQLDEIACFFTEKI